MVTGATDGIRSHYGQGRPLGPSEEEVGLVSRAGDSGSQSLRFPFGTHLVSGSVFFSLILVLTILYWGGGWGLMVHRALGFRSLNTLLGLFTGLSLCDVLGS